MSEKRKGMHLDLKSASTKRRLIKTEMLSTPDVLKLNLASPELEKFISDQTLVTPSPTQVFFPRHVTEEQEQYAAGFVDALAKLQQDDSSTSDEGSSASQDRCDHLSPIDMENQEKIKLERKRMRNRVAASKCRKRKLERIAKLEDKVKGLKDENCNLGDVLNRLKLRVGELKDNIRGHAQQGCHIHFKCEVD